MRLFFTSLQDDSRTETRKIPKTTVISPETELMQAQANRHSIFQRSISEIAQGTSTSAENLDTTDGSDPGNNSKILVRRRNNSGATVSGKVTKSVKF